MVKVYVNLLKKQLKKAEDIPLTWRADVIAAMEEEGYVEDPQTKLWSKAEA